MMRIKVNRQAGVTLTELLVVLVIVSILATIAVPVYINKAENARISVAQVECRQYAEAEESCAVQHGFYVPLQVLDDIAKDTTSNTNADSIDRETGVYAIDQAKAYNLLGTSQVEISASATDARVANMVNKWQGPFITPQRVYTGPDTSTGTPSTAYAQRDVPLDPWGNPYRFYAPGLKWGIIGSNGTSVNPSDFGNVSFADGQVTSTDPREYDRYAIVSYGPDGVSATDSSTYGTTNNDDITYFFGKPNPDRSNSTTSGTVTATPTI